MLHGRRTIPQSNLLPLSTWHSGVTLNIDYIKYRLALHPNTVNIVFITDTHVGPEYGVRFNAYANGIDIDNKNTSVSRGRLNSYYNNNSKTNRLDRACVALKKIAEQAKIDCIILGGDYISNSANTTEASAKKALDETNSCIKKLNNVAPIFICKGNHDSNTIGDFTRHISHEDYVQLIYNDIPRSANVVYGNENRDYGYYDIPSKKLRILWLNTYDMDASGGSAQTSSVNPQLVWFFQQALLNFLISALTILESGWKVACFSHISYFSKDNATPADSSGTDYWEAITKMFIAFKHNLSGSYSRTSTNSDFSVSISYDFTNNGTNTLLGLFCGHYHLDGRGAVIYKLSGSDIELNPSTVTNAERTCVGVIDLASLVINNDYYYEGSGSITSLNSADSGGNATSASNATKYESSFSILSIDTENNVVYENRFGGGFSWDFLYETSTSSPNTNLFIRDMRSATITVLDSNSSAISGASVVFKFNGADITCSTNSSGVVTTGKYLPKDKFLLVVLASGYKDYYENITSFSNITKPITLTTNEE